jgi:hypothetical protein
LAELTYHNQFEKKFDFLAINKQLINGVSSGEWVNAQETFFWEGT